MMSILAIVLAGCTVDGSAERAHADLATLDYGEFQHLPLHVPPGTEYSGKIIESMRLGEVMIAPAAADSALTGVPRTKPFAPLPTPAKVSGVLSEQARSVLDKHGMLAGAVVSGTDSADARTLTLVALRMPDNAAAAAAASEIDAADAAVNTENVAIAIPNYPTARAHWRPQVPSMAATIARGAFALSVLAVHTSPDATALTTMISKAFDAQLPGLERFVATPPEQFASLPIDPERMLTRMVPEKPGRWSMPSVTLIDPDMIAGGKALLYASGVVYGPNATYLYGAEQRATSETKFAMMGFDGLKRLSDPVLARESMRRSDAQFDAMRAVTPPAGIEDIRCGDDPAGSQVVRYSCRILYGRYLAIVFAAEEKLVLQKAAAQYSLLVRAE